MNDQDMTWYTVSVNVSLSENVRLLAFLGTNHWRDTALLLVVSLQTLPLVISLLFIKMCPSVAVKLTTYFKLGNSHFWLQNRKVQYILVLRGAVSLLPAVDTLIILRIYALYKRSLKSKDFCPTYVSFYSSVAYSWRGFDFPLAWYVRDALICTNLAKPLFSWDNCKGTHPYFLSFWYESPWRVCLRRSALGLRQPLPSWPTRYQVSCLVVFH